LQGISSIVWSHKLSEDRKSCESMSLLGKAADQVVGKLQVSSTFVVWQELSRQK
jgi:hypothetical protein